jgi:peptidoglycan/LPS O-acetylase OafA/YrhL
MTNIAKIAPETMNATGTKPQPAPEDKPKDVQTLLLPLVLLSGILLIAPFFLPGVNTLSLTIVAVALFLPHLVVGWRLLRAPVSKEGPGLAAGVAVIFVVIAAVGCALTIDEGSYLKLGYFAALGLLHALLVAIGFMAFRQGTSKKPAWRVAVRSVVDPIVYYGIVIFLGLAALAHH